VEDNNMAENTQMNENERGVFSLLHGLSGFLIAVVLLLSILGTLTVFGIGAQANNATKFYEINQDLNGLKMNSPANHTMRTIK
jgi:succinate dehydrogenase/fumarate reductase cytochrome b subunit